MYLFEAREANLESLNLIFVVRFEYMDKAVFAGGCFWCTEAIFEKLKGVTSVVSGYAGGEMENPDYVTVSSGKTGHAEAVQVTYNPDEITFKDLLYVFLRTHDPTTPNQQGADQGTQYRSVIFYETSEQKTTAEDALKEVQKELSSTVVTEISKLNNFYEAEDYHQDFYKNNPNKTYCKLVIDPKIEKLKKEFKEYLSNQV